MKNNLYKLKNDSFSSILQAIHKEIIEKMNRQSLAKEGLQIQNILRKIKQTARRMSEKSQSAILNNMNTELVELINETFKQQKKVDSRLNESHELFYRIHGQYIKDSDKKIDDIFEQEVAYLVKAAAKMRNINTNVDTILVGTKEPSSATVEKISKNIEKKAIDYINKAIERQEKDINRIAKIKQQQIQARAGKVDIDVPYLEVQGNVNDIISQLLYLFSNRTFSLKNYKDKLEVSNLHIELGKSNLYKSITGALSQVLSDYRAQKTVFYRGMQILSGETKSSDSAEEQSQVLQHFSHLRFIYQLRGSGLFDTITGRKQIADFIIWNDPLSENIIVRSTADLIFKYIDQYSKMFSAVSISAAKLYANPLKD